MDWVVFNTLWLHISLLSKASPPNDWNFSDFSMIRVELEYYWNTTQNCYRDFAKVDKATFLNNNKILKEYAMKENFEKGRIL